MIDTSELLKPIPGDDPGGVSLLYEGTHERLMEARREEDPKQSMGVWDRPLKEASWSEVIELSKDVLSSKSKDLRVAVILVEALLVKNNFNGFKSGLEFLSKFIDEYWDELHPRIDSDDDMESRMLIFEWFSKNISIGIHLQHITSPVINNDHYNFFEWLEIERLYKAPQKRQSKREREHQANRNIAKPSIVNYEDSVTNTSTGWFEENHAVVASCVNLLSSLNKQLSNKMGDFTPSFRPLQKSLNNFLDKAKILCDQRALEEENLESDTINLESGATENGIEQPKVEVQREPDKNIKTHQSSPKRFSTTKPSSREEAYTALANITDFLMEQEPHSPTPYLLRRAASFKDMTLADMITTFVDDEWQRTNLLKLMGIDTADNNQKEIK
tara:strand:- start:1774 stop:2934 length:1161 start_codon:yes stop_codon:yes gene_type:complete